MTFERPLIETPLGSLMVLNTSFAGIGVETLATLDPPSNSHGGFFGHRDLGSNMVTRTLPGGPLG